MNKFAPIAVVMLAAISLSACTSTQRTLSGAAIGGGAGALVGGAVGGYGGAIAGGALGAAAGTVVAQN